VQTEDPSLEALATRVALLEAGTSAASGAPAASAAPRSKPQAAAPRAARTTASSAELPASEAQPSPPSVLSLRTPGPTAPLLEAHAAPAPPVETVAPLSETPASSSPLLQTPAPLLQTPGPPAPLSETPALPAPLLETPFLSAQALLAEAAAQPVVPTVQQVRSLWDQIRLRAEERHKPLRAPLSQATVDGLEGNALVIGVVDSLQESIMRERTAIVEGAVADVVRVPLRVLFKPRGRSVRPAPPERPAGPEGSARSDGGEIDLLAYARKKLGGTETA
jgi:hypothetical protein